MHLVVLRGRNAGWKEGQYAFTIFSCTDRMDREGSLPFSNGLNYKQDFIISHAES